MAVTQMVPKDDAPLTADEIRLLLSNLDKLSPIEAEQLNKELEEVERRAHVQAIRDDLIEFCKHMQSDFLVGKHHRHLADMLMACERGDQDRVGINMPPRFGKSQITSI